MFIRPFEIGEEDALHTLFFESIHCLARANYTNAQLDAWAPVEYDRLAWASRIRSNKPFVGVINGQLAGFADLQPSGYIDHFFVSPAHARQGVAKALMACLLQSAREMGISSIFSNVSLTAEPVFRKYGFEVERRNEISVRGVQLNNATMRLRLEP